MNIGGENFRQYLHKTEKTLTRITNDNQVRIINLKSNQHFQGLKKYFSNYLLNLKY